MSFEQMLFEQKLPRPSKHRKDLILWRLIWLLFLRELNGHSLKSEQITQITFSVVSTPRPGANLIKLFSVVSIEIRLECRCLQKCFLICNYYVGCLWARLLVLTQSFLIKFGVFYNKNKILTILFIDKYKKITL